MCIVSNVGDYQTGWWPEKYPTIIQPDSGPTAQTQYVWTTSNVTRAEFDALKAEVENLVKLLKLAKIIDETSGQPDCEMDEKVDLIKRIAELVGVDLEDVFG